jgi:hypothetical protein
MQGTLVLAVLNLNGSYSQEIEEPLGSASDVPDTLQWWITGPGRQNERMAYLIQWRLMFRVANRSAFDQCLTRVLPLLGSEYEAGEGQPYWKDPALWECTVVCSTAVGSAAEQVLACLLTAQRLATGWYITGALSADCIDGLSGVFAAAESTGESRVSGLEWASFDVATAGQA